MTRDVIQSNFEDFHGDNPEVYCLWDKFTRQLIDSGHYTGSAGLIAERIRWETAISTTSHPLKLNNNYRSRYARLWMETNPQWEGFFRTRCLAKDSYDSRQIPMFEQGAPA